MTSKQMLEELLEMAISNGADLKLTPVSIPDYAKLCMKSPWQEQLLFGSHDFVKALFEEKHIDLPYDYFGDVCSDYEYGDILPDTVWKLHLQQAAISDNPIKYLYEATKNE